MIPFDHLQCVTVQSQGLGLLKTWHQGERCSLQCVPRITYLLQPVWRKQRLIHLRSLQPALVGAAQCISTTPEGSCPSIPAKHSGFWFGCWPITSQCLGEQSVTPKNKQRTEMHKEGELHIHIFYPEQPGPSHDTKHFGSRIPCSLLK